jgi:hypothetical protein
LVDLFVGVSQPDVHRMFMLGVADDVPGARPFPKARGIHVDIVHSEPDAASFFAVELLDRRFETVFTALVEDLISSASTAKTSGDAVAAVVGRLQRWQRFLARGAEGLGWEAQRGLYGELYFMRHRLAPAAGVEEAVASWTGPSRAPQDFQTRGWAVEVKTTGTEQPQRLRVTSSRQLDDTGLTLLVVYHLSVDIRAAGQGETLPSMVDAMRSLAAAHPPSADSFEDHLLEMGYLDQNSDQYSSAAYTPRGESAYRVSDGFPRIVEAMLPAGVGDVSYVIDASACAPYELDMAELLASISAP